MKSSKLFIFIALGMLTLMFSCGKDEATEPYSNLTKLGVNTQLPHQVNILFQATDRLGFGLAGKTAKDFIIKENGENITSESQVSIKPTNQVDIKVKTILLIDNSASVQSNLEKIKAAANSLVDRKPEYQQMAIYVFARYTVMVQDLTYDKTKLKAAINSIAVGPSTTNLYGALAYAGSKDSIVKHGGTSIWGETFSIDSIRFGNLICFTDGKETTGIVDKQVAINAMKSKRAYMLGLNSTDLDVPTLKQMGQFYLASDINQVQQVFIDIQKKIEDTANSFYWLYYQSPKEGNKEHTLRLELIGNVNGSSTGYIETKFNSNGFTH